MGALAFLGPPTAFCSDICGALGSTEGLRGLWGGCRGSGGAAGLPYREQYHSFRQREQRLAASTPHTLQRGLSAARASIMSRL